MVRRGDESKRFFAQRDALEVAVFDEPIDEQPHVELAGADSLQNDGLGQRQSEQVRLGERLAKRLNAGGRK